MGCTILLLALMNLAERREEKRGKKTERGEKQTLNQPCIHTRGEIHHRAPQRQNSFA